MAIETVEDIKGLIGPSGLVIMEFIEDYTPYAKGSKAGFYPKEALALFKKEIALFALRPNIKPTDAEKMSPLEKMVGRSRVATSDQSVTKPAADEMLVSPNAGRVQIPENWETIYHLKRISIASKIRGIAFADVGGDDAAKQIIREELARRAKEQKAG